MNKTIIIVAILVIIVFGIGAYIIFSNHSSTTSMTMSPTPSGQEETNTPAQTSTPTPTPTPTATPSPSATPAPQNVTVSIKNFAFNPATLTIKAGTKVTWVNNDSAPHTVTSDSGTLLNSQTLSPGQSFSFTFTDPGSISYHCSIHPMMHGKVVVH